MNSLILEKPPTSGLSPPPWLELELEELDEELLELDELLELEELLLLDELELDDCLLELEDLASDELLLDD